MASVSRLPSGKWRVRWRDQTGKQVASEAVKTKIEAAALCRRVEADLQRQGEHDEVVRAGRLMSLGTVVDRYCESGLAAQRLAAGRAWEVRDVLGRLMDETEWETTAACTADAVDHWRIAARKAGRGDNPIRYLLAVLRWANGAPLRQPVDPGCFTLPRMPRPQRPPPALLTPEQVASVISKARKAAGETAAAIVEHLATYGCRPVEACRLVIGNVNVVAGTLAHATTKNGDPVTHPLFPEHVARYAELTKGRATDQPLFPSPDGDAWWLGKRGQAAELTNWYRDTCAVELPTAQAGIYCLKDYAISTMEAAGIDDRTKALFTGHRSMSSFARYKATNQDRATAALVKLRAVRTGAGWSCDTA
jgi:integrase